ncbi:Hypothetical protein Y17_2463 [Pectobacterium wasabiae CFBP 3304]|nr:Hypothetical protein Y17_2463 [Pectobacterium wasabiae CFBP 3304]
MLVNIVILFDGFLFNLQSESDTPNRTTGRNSDKTGKSRRVMQTHRATEKDRLRRHIQNSTNIALAGGDNIIAILRCRLRQTNRE